MSFSSSGSCLEPRTMNGREVVHMIRFVELRELEMEAVSDFVLGLVLRSRPVTVVLDFTAVEFLTAAALGKLVELHTRLRDLGKRLVLVNVSTQVLEVFEATKLDTVLEIFDMGPWGEALAQLSA